MSNDEVYAGGLLIRALDPATQPPAIQAFMSAEIEYLRKVIVQGMRVLDIGCGTGRHLHLLGDRLGLGVGVDYERSYVAEAQRRLDGHNIHFVAADATAIPLATEFDLAICLTNTWGTMSDKDRVLREMRRLAPRPGTRLLSVYSEDSLPARHEWYRRLGHIVTQETDDYLETEEGFRSEHFSEARLRRLVGICSIRPLSPIAYCVLF